jgi:hypothetical protein
MRALTVLLFLVNYILALSVALLFRGVALASFTDKEQPRDVLDTKDMTALKKSLQENASKKAKCCCH